MKEWDSTVFNYRSLHRIIAELDHHHFKTDAEVQCSSWFVRTSFLIFDCNYLAVHFVNLLCFSAAKYTAMYGYKEKNGHKKRRKIFICNKEITVKICDLIFDSSSPAWGGVYEANNKLLENYSFRRFESGGIRKTANFVPCVLATKLTVKMAKTLDISRVFVLCAFSGDNSGGTTRNRTGEWRFCRPLPYRLAMVPY